MRERLVRGCLAALSMVILLGVAPAGGQEPDPEAVLDHFRCYSPEAVGDPTPPLGLVDQFLSDSIETAFPFDLCNPVRKSGVDAPPAPPLLNPDAHLVCYRYEGSVEPGTVEVSNQFGVDTLQVFRPDRLCAPASKAVELPDGSLPEPPPLGDIEQRLDHFRCYNAGGTLLPPPVTMEDQFGTSQAFLGSAARVCNPVEKQRFGFPVTPIVRPFAHLVCYPFFAEPPGSAPNAATRNQFGIVQFFSILTGGFGELCVPSLKEEEPPPRVAQHFRVYRAVGGPATLEPLTLVDQFGEARVRLGPARLLMTPVEKRRAGREPEPIQRPDEHLRCYRIAGAAANRTVTISNQFRDATVVTVGKPTDLCAPASKVFEGEPGEPPVLNHYKCYEVSRTPSVAEDIGLTDQFGTEQVRVQRLSRLCNPVEKRRDGRPAEPVPHPTEHLACYQIRETAPFEARTVFTRDQFLIEPLEITQPSRLCVPSEKIEGGGI